MTVLRIVGYFWQMCLLRKGPEQLPSSGFAPGVALLIYILIALPSAGLIMPGQAFSKIVSTVAIGVILQAVITLLLLQFKRMPHRFRATWCALLGTNAVMLLITQPFNFIIMKSGSETLALVANSVTWVCLGWWLAIAGHIYHRAANIGIFLGSTVAFMIELLGVVIVLRLFPG